MDFSILCSRLDEGLINDRQSYLPIWYLAIKRMAAILVFRGSCHHQVWQEFFFLALESDLVHQTDLEIFVTQENNDILQTVAVWNGKIGSGFPGIQLSASPRLLTIAIPPFFNQLEICSVMTLRTASGYEITCCI